MLVGRVTGNVVSTNKVDTLHGAKLLIVQPVELDTLAMKDDYVVCVDDVGAGEGDLVFCAYGSSARQSDTSSKVASDYTIYTASWIPSTCAARAPTTRQRRRRHAAGESDWKHGQHTQSRTGCMGSSCWWPCPSTWTPLRRRARPSSPWTRWARVRGKSCDVGGRQLVAPDRPDHQ